MNGKLASLLIATASMSGCMSVPDRIDGGWSHDSYPALGWPFGPKTEEDSLDTLGLRAAWHHDRYYMEVGLGTEISDGGFYGDGVIFTSRVGVTLWERK